MPFFKPKPQQPQNDSGSGWCMYLGAAVLSGAVLGYNALCLFGGNTATLEESPLCPGAGPAVLGMIAGGTGLVGTAILFIADVCCAVAIEVEKEIEKELAKDNGSSSKRKPA